jgi:multicomponent Na+:H+ antiporter subunit F
MHTIVFYLATAWLLGLVAITAVLIVGARSRTVRLLALDTLTMIVVALLVLYTYAERTAYYLDAALVLALLAFVGTVAAARYASEGEVFS